MQKPLFKGMLVCMLAWLFSAAAEPAPARSPVTAGHRMDDRTLAEFDFSTEERERLDRLIKAGLLEIVPVVRAPRDARHAHLGWPVATRLPGGRIVLVFRQKDGHHGNDEGSRRVIYSDDLTTWHPADALAREDSRLGDAFGMHAVGWAPDPATGRPRLVIFNGRTEDADVPYRTYLSENGGAHWTEARPFAGHLSAAVHTGPNMVIHPAFGLMGCAGQQTGPPHRSERRNYLVRSLDGGLTWDEHSWTNPAVARSVEPALATWGPGHMVQIAREYSSFGYGKDAGRAHFYLTQHVYTYRPGHVFSDIAFTTAATNIAGNGAADNGEARLPGRASQDTAEVLFNPVSGRLEVVQSHRWGGGQGRTGHTRAGRKEEEISSLNLWSIDPEELLAGSSRWRFDGTLIERIGYSRKGNKDGLHPGGSIVDLERGQQHIFVYAGWRRAPSSIYRISRTLDTETLRKAAGPDAGPEPE